MPKFRTDEPPEQSSSTFIGLLIVSAMLAVVVALFATEDPVAHRVQAKVFVPVAASD